MFVSAREVGLIAIVISAQGKEEVSESKVEIDSVSTP